mgnify:FL=1
MNRSKIGLIGYAGSGKDTIAEYLACRGYTRVAFADPVRSVLLSTNPLITRDGLRLRDAVEAYGWDRVKRTIPEVRELLQGLGAGVRDSLGESVWVEHALRRLDALSGPVVVTDVRYRNEALALRSRGFSLVWVQRPGVGPANTHPSETAIPADLADAVLPNSGDIPELYEAVDALLRGG